MGLCSAVGTQFLVERVLNEGMGEAVRPGIGRFVDQGRRRRTLENEKECLRRHLQGAGEQFQVKVPTDDGSHRQDPLNLGTHPNQSGRNDVANAPRQAVP